MSHSISQSQKNPHGVPNQINIYKLDKESVITGFGIHERVCGFEPHYDHDHKAFVRYCRIDRRYGLPDPTDAQIISVLRKYPILAKGKMSVLTREVWNDGNTVDVLVKSH